MKKIFVLGLSLFLLVSCSSDDSNSIDGAKLTNKKWVTESFTVFGQTIPIENDYPNCERDYVMFKSGGVFETTSHNEDCEEFINTGSWTLNGNIITTNEDGDVTNATIKKLTNTQLQVTTQADFDDDGEMETVTLLLKSN